jgi:hypothetical protein
MLNYQRVSKFKVPSGFGKRQIRTSAWWEARAEPDKRQHMAMETLR